MALSKHGIFPEEHVANYMESQALNQSKSQYLIDNFLKESIIPPKGFIEDYLQYLSNDVRNKIHNFILNKK